MGSCETTSTRVSSSRARSKIEGKSRRVYGEAQTPITRVLASAEVSAATKETLRQKKAGLNPFALKLAVNKRMKEIETMRRRHHHKREGPAKFCAPPQKKNQRWKPHEPPTAGGRELRLKARPPAHFNSLRSPQTVNQEQRPTGNTLLAQRYPNSGNSYFWQTADQRSRPRPPPAGRARNKVARLNPATGAGKITFANLASRTAKARGC